MKFDRLLPPSTYSSYAQEIQMVLDKCIADHRRVHVLIEPEKRGRSTGDFSQNHHLNGHIQQISVYTGQPFEDIKKYVKQMAISQGYPILTKAGNPVIDMWGQAVGISEADASTSECAILINCVHQLASELGIILEEGNGRFSY